MMFPTELFPPIVSLIRLGADAIDGRLQTPEQLARALVNIGLDLVPVDELKRYLTEHAKFRAELLADGAEAKKFGQR